MFLRQIGRSGDEPWDQIWPMASMQSFSARRVASSVPGSKLGSFCPQPSRPRARPGRPARPRGHRPKRRGARSTCRCRSRPRVPRIDGSGPGPRRGPRTARRPEGRGSASSYGSRPPRGGRRGRGGVGLVRRGPADVAAQDDHRRLVFHRHGPPERRLQCRRCRWRSRRRPRCASRRRRNARGRRRSRRARSGRRSRCGCCRRRR